MKPYATKSSAKIQMAQRKAHTATFSKVLNGRKQPIRGLWIRNSRFYARLAIEDENTGLKAVRRVALLDSDRQPVQTAAQATQAMERLRTQRADKNLPQLGHPRNQRRNHCVANRYKAF
jgi:hypothetical protein